MKKTKKIILGFSGLALVATMTIVAALLPNPSASAISTVTDTITVRVIGNAPSAEIANPTSGETFVSSDQTININYENVATLDLVVKFTDRNGVEHEKILHNGDVAEETGSLSYNFTDLANELGFGEYTIFVNGTGIDSAPIPGDSIDFLFIPVIATPEQDPNTGKTYLNLDYDPFTESGTGKVSTLEINVYDKNGNLIESLSPIIVNAPENKVEIPFSEQDLESGKYVLEIIAYGNDKNELYTPFATDVKYEAKEWSGEDVIPDTNAPDTGGFLGSLNISKADYLITGAMIFLIAGASAFVFILKKSSSSSKK